MATPKVVAEQRRLWPDSPANCADGHVGPFTLGNIVGCYSCNACGKTMQPTDALAHSVFMDPTIDPYEICAGGSGRPVVEQPVTEWDLTAFQWARVAIGTVAFLAVVWFVMPGNIHP